MVIIMKKIYINLFLMLMFSVVFLYGCSESGEIPESSEIHDTIETIETMDSDVIADEVKNPPQTPPNVPDWLNIDFADVNTGQTHKISDFTGKPVLVESFAIWCPTCTRQQDKIKEFHEEVGDSVISISLDTDPNEDTEAVKSHSLEHGFDWIYAVSPVPLTRSLIDEFGQGVVNAPSVPVILVCPDQNFKMLSRGVKSVDDLKSAITQGC
jgi:thiol-disulfide isomerase/thioredoxin